MRRRTALAALAAAAALHCAPAAPRDVVPESRDVTTDRGPAGYMYVARRPLGVVGLLEAREIPEADARALTDRVADAVQRCAYEDASRDTLLPGAARVIATIDDGGIVQAPKLVLSPGGGAQATALRCLVVPLRLLRLAPSRAGSERRIALEATWGAP